MKGNFTNRKILWAFAVATAFLIILVTGTYSNMRYVYKDNQNVKQLVDELVAFDLAIANVRSLDTGLHKYMLMENEDSLDLFYSGLSGIRRDYENLAAIKPKKKTDQQRVITSLMVNILQKTTFEADVLDKMRVSKYDSTMKAGFMLIDKKLTDSITTGLRELQKNNRQVLQQTNEERQRSSRNLATRIFILAFLFLSILGTAYYLTNRDFKTIYEAEKELKFNASLIRNLSDPIITTDIDNKITNWNIYATELYGYEEKDVVGKDIGELLHIDANNKPLNDLRNPDSKKDFWKGDLVLFHKNGSAVISNMTVSAILDEEGQKFGTVAVIRDITQRKKTEQKLQALTTNLEDEVRTKVAELNSVFERITDAFIALDNNWNYTYINQKAAELHNRKIEDLIGKNIWEEYPDVMNEAFYEALQEAKNSNTAQRLELYYAASDKWFEDLIYPSPDGISVYYHDITEKKKAELNLRSAHEKLSYHINNTPLGVVEFDLNKRINQWSDRAEEMFGWTMQEMMNEPDILGTLVYHEDITLVEKALSNMLDNEYKNGVIKIRNNTKDGRVLHCEWYSSILKDDMGKVTGAISMVHDVTVEKNIQIELKEAEAKFRSLVEQSIVGVYIMQGNKFAYANPRLHELTGYTEDDMINKLSILDVVYPEDRQIVTENIKRRLNGELESINYELRCLKKNGELFYAEVFGSVTQYLGKPAIIGTLIDITEKNDSLFKIQESEKALKASNERFQLVAKATNDALRDWNITDNTIWGNEVFSAFFEKTAGSDIYFSDFVERLYSDDRDRVIARLRSAIKNKQAIFTDEYRFRVAKNGYLNFRDRSYIIYDQAGNPARMLGAMQDITEQKKNERQIIFEKELSDSIINSLPGIFYLYNKEGNFFRWNKNMEKVTGYSAAELEQLHPLALFDEKDRPLMQRKIANVFVAGEDFAEAALMCKDGTRIPYYFTGMVIQYEGELCLMGVGIDISDRVKSQQKLAQSEERYRTVIEQASDGIFISDAAGYYIDVNSNGEKLSGYTKEELIDKNIFELTSGGIKNEPNQLFENLKQGQVVISETAVLRKDGSLVEVEISAKQLADGRLLAIVRDISARKKAAEALVASEQKYRFLFNQNPMPMWMVSMPERKFLDVNNAAINFYGYSKEEFLKMTAYDIRPQNQISKLMNFNSHEVSGVFNAGIWEHMKKDGNVVKVNIITHKIDYEGKDARLVLANDVTEKILAEDALKKSHEEFRQLASHLEKIRESERTHIAREIHDELGQQLTGLKMDISWINRRIKSQDLEVQQKITETIQLIDGTVKTVRRIATELRPSILDDLGLVAAMEWQSSELEKRFEISCKFTSNMPVVDVHTDMATGLFRIYQECLTNVIRHAEATEVIAFLEARPDQVVLTITDNGKGFDPADIVNKKTLGLLGMKERASIMGGEYRIASVPGEGASIIITVPLKK